MATLPQVGGQMQSAPPDIPPMPTVPPSIPNYLRVLNIWLTQQLASKVPAQSAVPSIMLLSPGGVTWKLTVQDNGSFIGERVTPGSKPT